MHAKKIITTLASMALLAASSSAMAESSSMVFAYPKHLTPTGGLSLFAANAYSLNNQTNDANIKGFNTKVYDILGTDSGKIYNAGYCSNDTNNPFFSGCIPQTSAFASKANSYALINGAPGNYALSGGFGTTVGESLIKAKIYKYFSAAVLDIETINMPITSNGRGDFYKSLFATLNNAGMPVQVYVNPNIADFTQKDATLFNKLIKENYVINKTTGATNMYLFPIYDGTTATSLTSAMKLIGNAPFKLIVSVDQGANIQDEIDAMKPVFAYGIPAGFKGFDYYQYTTTQTTVNGAPKTTVIGPVTDNISQIKAAVPSVK